MHSFHFPSTLQPLAQSFPSVHWPVTLSLHLSFFLLLCHFAPRALRLSLSLASQAGRGARRRYAGNGKRQLTCFTLCSCTFPLPSLSASITPPRRLFPFPLPALQTRKRARVPSLTQVGHLFKCPLELHKEATSIYTSAALLSTQSHSLVFLHCLIRPLCLPVTQPLCLFIVGGKTWL